MNILAIKRLAKKNYMCHVYGNNPKIVIMGETHGKKDLLLEEEFIELIKPKLIFHEGAKKEYLNNREIGDQEYVKRVLSWEQMFGIPVKSPDVPFLDKKRKDREDLIKSVDRLFEEFSIPKKQVKAPSKSRMGIMSIIREEVMFSNIMKEHDKLPLMIVVGDYHISPDSIFINKFLKEKIDFVALSGKKYRSEKNREFAAFYK